MRDNARTDIYYVLVVQVARRLQKEAQLELKDAALAELQRSTSEWQSKTEAALAAQEQAAQEQDAARRAAHAEELAGVRGELVTQQQVLKQHLSATEAWRSEAQATLAGTLAAQQGALRDAQTQLTEEQQKRVASTAAPWAARRGAAPALPLSTFKALKPVHKQSRRVLFGFRRVEGGVVALPGCESV